MATIYELLAARQRMTAPAEKQNDWPPYPVCPFKSGSVSGRHGTIVKQHPGWSAWFKKYPDVGAWCRANPGKMAGRSLREGPKLTYYSEVSSRGMRFSTAAESSMTPCSTRTIYATFAEWNNAYECYMADKLHAERQMLAAKAKS